MGVAPGAVKLYLELWQRDFWKNIDSVMEMGSQELHLTKEHFEDLTRASGISYNARDFRLLANYPTGLRLSSKVFYKMLGVREYASIDLNGIHNAIKHNLNLPYASPKKYDLVTDHGTNEHIFNIVEAYRTMHRLCKPEGFLIIIQRYWKGNGYYLFEPSFFEGMAKANNYRILSSSYMPTIKGKGTYQEFHIPLSNDLLNLLDWSKTNGIGICYVFQKQSAADFRYP